MKSTMLEPQLIQWIDQLLTVLDKDMQHIEHNIERLNRLRSLLVRQDRKALEQLLQTIRMEVGTYRQNEQQRQALRRQMADVFACTPREMTLSFLLKRLPENKQIEIAKRRNTLRTLTGLLKKEYAATQMLLIDCARFNRLLLNGIFRTSQPGNLTYESTGMARRQADSGLMNMQL